MRILAISDEVLSTLYNPQVYSLIGSVDVVVSCGDLSYSYMEYVVTHTNVRHAYFVHGNHDSPEHLCSGQILEEPGGWCNIDRRAVYAKEIKLIIAGLEGSICYRPGARYQYSEREMRWRARRLIPRLLFNRVFYGRYLDVLVAHSPARWIHDGPDAPHRGFDVFLALMQRFRPRLFLHGHSHHYGIKRWHTHYEDTEVINIHPFRLIKLEGDGISYGSFCYR